MIKKYITTCELEGSWYRELPVHNVKLDPSLKHTNFQEYSRQLGDRSRALRIDGLCVGPKTVTIIEAKKSLNAKALGQLLCYRCLLELNYPEFCAGKQIDMVVLVQETNDFLEPIFEQFDIKIEIFTGK